MLLTAAAGAGDWNVKNQLLLRGLSGRSRSLWLKDYAITFAVAGAVTVNSEKKKKEKIFLLQLRGLFRYDAAVGRHHSLLFLYGSTGSGSGSSLAVVLEGVGYITVQCAVLSYVLNAINR
jgi:hypothetical protein